MEKTIINILASAANVEAVRTKATENGISFNNTLLRIPLSPTGALPATAWFCSFAATPEIKTKILELQDLSEVSFGSAKAFLETKGLKYII